MIAIVLAVFFASGFAALLYQVIWQRVLVMFSGADVYAATLIGLMIWRPEGLFGERELFQRKSRKPEAPKGPDDPPKLIDERPASAEGLS